jgi:hypothetical protein
MKMDGRYDETGTGIEIEVRLAELNRLHRQLEKRQEQFRNLQENAIAMKIENITRLLHSIRRPAPGVASRGQAVLPRWPDRRRQRRGHGGSQSRWPPCP